MKLFSIALFLIFTGCQQAGEPKITTVDSPSVTEKVLPAEQDTVIQFKATGNEPFWNLEIDFEKTMHLKTLNGLDMYTPAVPAEKMANDNITQYTANTESGTLIVSIKKGGCIDDMSGQKFDYSVTVDVKTGTEKDFTHYKGCGRYLGSARN